MGETISIELRLFAVFREAVGQQYAHARGARRYDRGAST